LGRSIRGAGLQEVGPVVLVDHGRIALVTVHQLLLDRREEILDLARRHGAENVRVFGSAARGEANEASDIDFLVSAGPQASPWFPAGLVEDLERLLGCKVDVVLEDGLYWLLRRRILRESRPL
jgi:predicted nucleotidyltransferase